jgi:hypothetical protein
LFQGLGRGAVGFSPLSEERQQRAPDLRKKWGPLDTVPRTSVAVKMLGCRPAGILFRGYCTGLVHWISWIFQNSIKTKNLKIWPSFQNLPNYSYTTRIVPSCLQPVIVLKTPLSYFFKKIIKRNTSRPLKLT